MFLVGRFIRGLDKCRRRLPEGFSAVTFGSIFLFSGAAVASAVIVWIADPADPMLVARFGATCVLGCYLSIALYVFDGPPRKGAVKC